MKMKMDGDGICLYGIPGYFENIFTGFIYEIDPILGNLSLRYLNKTL